MTPGWPLELRQDAGGDRWHVADRPVSAGAALELAVRTDARRCKHCQGDGCDQCNDRGEHYTLTWLPVRFEYFNGRNGPDSRAFLYLPTWGTRSARIEVDPVNGPAVRVRHAEPGPRP
jgi:hypothetical protein